MSERDFENEVNKNVEVPSETVGDSSFDASAREKIEKSNETVKDLTGRSKKKTIFIVIFVIANILAVLVTALNEFGGNKVSTPPAEVLSTWGNNWKYVIYAVLCIVGVIFFDVVKTTIYIKRRTGKFMFGLSVKNVILGKYYDNITPSATGGQPFQIYYLNKNGVPSGVASSLPIVSFFLNQLAFIMLALPLIIIFGGKLVEPPMLVTAYIGAGIAFLFPLTIMVCSALPKVTRAISKFIIKLGYKLKIVKNYDETYEKVAYLVGDYTKSIRSVSHDKLWCLIAFLSSLAVNIANCSIPYFVILACGQSLGYVDVLAMCFITYSAISFIPTPGNAGAAEASFYLVFSVLSGGFLFMGMLLWRFISFYLVIIVGFILMMLNIRRKKENVVSK